MKAVSFEPVKVEAMINSLGEKREVFIVSYENVNNVKAVYNNKLCTAIYNMYTGLFYVDDIYGVVDTLEVNRDGSKWGLPWPTTAIDRNDTIYFLVHRKSSDTWHIGYADNSDAGMISLFPTNIPETYKSKTVATDTMHCLVAGSRDKKSSDIVYEIDKLFDKADAIAFVKRILQDKSEENRNENNPC